MPISADEAAQVAIDHALDPTAAVALRDLADDAAHADELAAMFADSRRRTDEIVDRIMNHGG